MKIWPLIRKRSIRHLFDLISRALKTYSIKDFDTCGTGVLIKQNVFISHPQKVQLGNNVYIGPNCDFFSAGGLIVEDGTVIGSNVVVMTSTHNYNSSDLNTLPFDDRNVLNPVKIEKFCWVGTNAIILPGVTIGEGSVIGAGSVVTHDIPKLTVCAGNPVKVIKQRDPKQYYTLSAQSLSWVNRYQNNNPSQVD